MLMALLISFKNVTLIMVASPLPWKVQWAHHGMGFVTINGEDRLAMFGDDSAGCTWHDCVVLYITQTKQWKTATMGLRSYI